MTKSYGTFAQLTDTGYLGAGAELLTYQTTLQRMLESASEEVDHTCFRTFQPWEGIRYYDGAGVTFIPNDDILSISAFALDMDGSQAWATSLDTDEYFMYPLSEFPKLYIKMSHLSSVGFFASGIRSGIKVTGVYGHGDGYSATPYHDSQAVVGAGNITAAATSHALATGSGALFSAGNTIRIGTEQLYITSVVTDTLYFQLPRGRNGTTAAAHTAADKIYIYDYPGPVTEATLLLATGWWKQRENPATYMSGDQITGTYTVTKDMEKIITRRLDHHIKRKLV
jgi:hypothetical protein